jgi:phospholipase C
VQPGADISDSWALSANSRGGYDLSVYGPNGFLRSFKGSTSGQNVANLQIETSYDNSGVGIKLEITNRGATCQVSVDAYSKDQTTHTLKAGEELTKHRNLKKSYDWYDLVIEVNTDTSFQRQIAGHVETGGESMTDPAIGAVKTASA